MNQVARLSRGYRCADQSARQLNADSCLYLLFSPNISESCSEFIRGVMKTYEGIFKALFILVFFGVPTAPAASLPDLQARIRAVGNQMLEHLEVSYVYGGSKVGDAGQCEKCNTCLEENQPAPKERFKVCGVCSQCSLDCSHFVQLVFANAGLRFPYLTSQQMLDLDQNTLRRRYHLLAVPEHPGKLLAGDLLVYRGHVVIAEMIHGHDSVDVIHATGGRDIREPGQGIQRERFARASNFRGPLLRVLRHEKMVASASVQTGNSLPADRSAPPLRSRLRPVEKKSQAGAN